MSSIAETIGQAVHDYAEEDMAVCIGRPGADLAARLVIRALTEAGYIIDKAPVSSLRPSEISAYDRPVELGTTYMEMMENYGANMASLTDILDRQKKTIMVQASLLNQLHHVTVVEEDFEFATALLQDHCEPPSRGHDA